ncbi:hypothetical protein H6P81_020723 [Aristolochia fimbriata]|uniref:Uncharacterized protein n=1 Tax=Aristolochia fimbriata TaxID=158543 RepID=A0AAV7DVD6_ARIFI|nr:hypothetical protein H6P81_020723 [Aristolochia fimbriata]
MQYQAFRLTLGWGVAGGSSSENCKSGWPSRERYRLLNFEGIRYDEMTDTDLALSNLGSASFLIARKLRYFPRLEIVEAVADLFYERGDLNIARGYYMDALRELYALDTSGDKCVLQRAKINFKACLLLVATDFGSDVLTYAEKVWSDGISYGKSSLNEAQGRCNVLFYLIWSRWKIGPKRLKGAGLIWRKF